MTDAERQHAIRQKVDALLAELRGLAESDPNRLNAVDFMILAIEQIGRNAAVGKTTVVDAPLATILVDGAVALLTDWAGDVIDVEEASAQALERELAGKPPAILH